jgi:hypothetical protein
VVEEGRPLRRRGSKPHDSRIELLDTGVSYGLGIIYYEKIAYLFNLVGVLAFVSINSTAISSSSICSKLRYNLDPLVAKLYLYVLAATYSTVLPINISMKGLPICVLHASAMTTKERPISTSGRVVGGAWKRTSGGEISREEEGMLRGRKEATNSCSCYHCSAIFEKTEVCVSTLSYDSIISSLS